MEDLHRGGSSPANIVRIGFPEVSPQSTGYFCSHGKKGPRRGGVLASSAESSWETETVVKLLKQVSRSARLVEDRTVRVLYSPAGCGTSKAGTVSSCRRAQYPAVSLPGQGKFGQNSVIMPRRVGRSQGNVVNGGRRHSISGYRRCTSTVGQAELGTECAEFERNVPCRWPRMMSSHVICTSRYVICTSM